MMKRYLRLVLFCFVGLLLAAAGVYAYHSFEARKGVVVVEQDLLLFTDDFQAVADVDVVDFRESSHLDTGSASIPFLLFLLPICIFLFVRLSTAFKRISCHALWQQKLNSL